VLNAPFWAWPEPNRPESYLSAGHVKGHPTNCAAGRGGREDQPERGRPHGRLGQRRLGRETAWPAPGRRATGQTEPCWKRPARAPGPQGGRGGRGEPTARRPRAQGTGEAPGGRPGKPLLAHDRGPLPPRLIAARVAPACGTRWPWAAPSGHMASAWPPCPTEPRCGARRRRQRARSHARPRWAAGWSKLRLRSSESSWSPCSAKQRGNH